MLIIGESMYAEIDSTFPTESRRKAEDILVEVKTPYHIQVFGGVEHGFAVRGNDKDRLSSALMSPLCTIS